MPRGLLGGVMEEVDERVQKGVKEMKEYVDLQIKKVLGKQDEILKEIQSLSKKIDRLK